MESSLSQRQNIFNLVEFPQFVESDDASLLLSKVQNDLRNWNYHLVLIYYSLNFEAIPKDLKPIITQEVRESNFDAEIKIPLRTILDPCFTICYKQGKKI